MNIKEQIKYWHSSAHENWETAEILFKHKKYDDCLFFCHLSIEKLLKGLVIIETKQMAPRIHDLAKLAAIANIKINKEMISRLRLITTFNIAGRYADEKTKFHKECTMPFTIKHLKISKKIFLWLAKIYPSK